MTSSVFRSLVAVHLRIKKRIQSLTIPNKNVLTTYMWHSSDSSLQPKEENKAEPQEKVKFSFLTADGEQIEVEGIVGETILRVGQDYEVGMEGACEQSLACTTCHVYVDDEIFDNFPAPSPKEEDLLDIAPFLKPNSRLSCQLKITKDIAGRCFALPRGTVNMQVDGFKPKKH